MNVAHHQPQAASRYQYLLTGDHGSDENTQEEYDIINPSQPQDKSRDHDLYTYVSEASPFRLYECGQILPLGFTD